MHTIYPPLLMSAATEVDGTEVWFTLPLSEVAARGLEAHVRDTLDEGHGYVVLPLSEVSDAPRCEACQKATPSLVACTDDDGDTEYRCADCVPVEDDGDHYDAPDPRYGEVDDGPMTTADYLGGRLGRVGY